MKFAPENPYSHGQAARVGVLLVNLGTPDAPTAPAVRRYLAQFLSDPRVVEIPKAIWWPILHGIILRVRPSKSAAKYASIWTEAGSPLAVWTQKQATLLRGSLGERGFDVVVAHAMTYGQPSVASALDALRAEACDRVLVLPMYPQYSGTTTASVYDAVQAWSLKSRNQPEFRFIKQYHDDAAYIEALATRVEGFWAREGRPDHVLLSFHGVPERTLKLGDPYHCQCYKTGRLLRERLGLTPAQMSLSFQSRFGKAKWLEPYTEPTLVKLAQQGVKHVQVFCPGFPADCLETLEEIAMEGRHTFLEAGGERFEHIPCLNDEPACIRAMAALVAQHTQGWPARRGEAPDADQRAALRQHALAVGAPD